ncbi:MAG: type II toxin-antitoxin system HicA family toxin [Actinomycetota bacterium]
MIKRRDLERYLLRQGCAVVREGGKHTVWENPSNDRRSTIPRHNEIPRVTARAICDQLGVKRFI